MIIAIEGTDKTGKSHTANLFEQHGKIIYDVSKNQHESLIKDYSSSDLIIYDRVDWISHTVYRLALPTYEWNDPKIRTVFAMPQAHLLIKTHNRYHVKDIQDELYQGEDIARINNSYSEFMEFLLNMNLQSDFSLFKSISCVEVTSTPTQFSQEIKFFYSKDHTIPDLNLEVTNEDILEFFKRMG